MYTHLLIHSKYKYTPLFLYKDWLVGFYGISTLVGHLIPNPIYTHTHTHTHTYIHTYICIYIYVCVICKQIVCNIFKGIIVHLFAHSSIVSGIVIKH